MERLDGADENPGFNRGQTIMIGDDNHQNEEDGIKPKVKVYPKIDPAKFQDELVCRICLSEDEPGNPIISPCKCIGSVRYIHLKCI